MPTGSILVFFIDILHGLFPSLPHILLLTCFKFGSPWYVFIARCAGVSLACCSDKSIFQFPVIGHNGLWLQNKGELNAVLFHAETGWDQMRTDTHKSRRRLTKDLKGNNRSGILALCYWSRCNQIYVCFKSFFLKDKHCKSKHIFSDLLKITRIFWTSFRLFWYNIVNVVRVKQK